MLWGNLPSGGGAGKVDRGAKDLGSDIKTAVHSGVHKADFEGAHTLYAEGDTVVAHWDSTAFGAAVCRGFMAKAKFIFAAWFDNATCAQMAKTGHFKFASPQDGRVIVIGHNRSVGKRKNDKDKFIEESQSA